MKASLGKQASIYAWLGNSIAMAGSFKSLIQLEGFSRGGFRLSGSTIRCSEMDKTENPPR